MASITRRRSIGIPTAGAGIGGATTLLYVLFIGLPVGALLFKAGQQEGFFITLTSGPALTALRLSLVTSAISMLVIVLVGTPFAYLLARSKSPVLRLVDTLVELPLVMPPVVAGVAMLMAFGRRGVLGAPLEDLGITLPFTTAAVIMAQIFVASPFFIRAAKLGFQSVATDHEDISRTLGVSPWWTFWRITLPLAAPSLLTGLALSWARAVSEFGATIMFAGNLTGKTQTMPLAIMSAMETSLNTALVLSVLLILGSLTLLAAMGYIARRRWQGEA